MANSIAPASLPGLPLPEAASGKALKDGPRAFVQGHNAEHRHERRADQQRAPQNCEKAAIKATKSPVDIGWESGAPGSPRHNRRWRPG